ncbi:hypothetical protein S40285_10835 [Stachybotrys chlorohalonatus IBT 40285]|uniref:Uncharacterized protein n=1 Tax=Stachybotrys chlorohalonatus (strain IBT 40285) TaxID=1283841 RepID=A0A084QXF5_STAC4|nr:hypothetical protein S40285_10835 [Stachybotrys chlorohalonata IBT 40285]
MSVLVSPQIPSRARELVRQIWPQLPRENWQETHYTVVADTFKALGGARDGGQRVVESTLLRRFTIPNLVQDYRWTVQWTSNLADHLLIERMGTGKRVTIYEHKICLLNHLQYGQDCPVPRDALEEALDTLNLLFPPTDPATHRYLKAQHRPFHQLGFCSRNVKRDLQHYRYWQNNLVDLLHDLEEQPYGLGQLRLDKDRRNLLQFATFWIATIVALLTVISIAFGVVSTVYAARQYNLALAQACSTPDGAVNLPEYCS